MLESLLPEQIPVEIPSAGCQIRLAVSSSLFFFVLNLVRHPSTFCFLKSDQVGNGVSMLQGNSSALLVSAPILKTLSSTSRPYPGSLLMGLMKAKSPF